SDVRDDAYDLKRLADAGGEDAKRSVLEVGDAKRLADRIVIGPVEARHRFVDHRERGAAHGLGLVPDSPGKHGNPEEREVFRTDHAETRMLLVVRDGTCGGAGGEVDSCLQSTGWRRC